MLGSHSRPWIKTEFKSEPEPIEPINVEHRVETIRTVLGSYIHDHGTTQSVPEMRMVDPVEHDVPALEEQVHEINRKTLPVADEPWQLVEEYEKDALLATRQTDILQQRLRDGALQKSKSQKKKRGTRRKKRSRDADQNIPAIPPALGEPAELMLQEPRPPTRRLTLGDVMGDLPIETLRQEALRNDSDARFLTHESITQRIPEEAVASVIKYQDVVAWVGKMNKRPLWFRNLPQLCIDTNTDVPDLEVITWAHVQQYLREPDPTCMWERPCLPPVDAQTGRRLACESQRMGGPRLREFLLPSQHDAVMHAVRNQNVNSARNHDWVDVLPREQRMCFLCHQKSITTSFTRRRFFQKQAQQDDPAGAAAPGRQHQQEDKDEDEMVLIHDYVMAVNVPGEWDIDATLPGYETYSGLAGPVLAHDWRDYVAKQFPLDRHNHAQSGRLAAWMRQNDGKEHLDGWTMVDRVFFRPGVTRMYMDRQ